MDGPPRPHKKHEYVCPTGSGGALVVRRDAEIPTGPSRTFLPTLDDAWSGPDALSGAGRVVLGTGMVLASSGCVSTSRNVGWLLLVLRAKRRQRLRARGTIWRLARPPRRATVARLGERRARPGHLRLIAGGSDLDSDTLRQGVRERLADGRLFFAGSMSVARRGTNRPCLVCGKAITRESVEREVEGPGDTHGLAHEDCYRIWREESRRSGASESTR